jgi:hypothetical protein
MAKMGGSERHQASSAAMHTLPPQCSVCNALLATEVAAATWLSINCSQTGPVTLLPTIERLFLLVLTKHP